MCDSAPISGLRATRHFPGADCSEHAARLAERSLLLSGRYRAHETRITQSQRTAACFEKASKRPESASAESRSITSTRCGVSSPVLGIDDYKLLHRKGIPDCGPTALLTGCHADDGCQRHGNCGQANTFVQLCERYAELFQKDVPAFRRDRNSTCASDAVDPARGKAVSA